MKKVSYLLGLLLIGAMIVSSCTKDEAEQLAPSLAFLGGIYQPLNLERIDSDVTLDVGSQFVFGVTSTAQSDKNLNRIRIERVFENVATVVVLDSAFDSKTFTLDLIGFAYPTAGTEDFTVQVWDKNDKSASIGFTITTEVADPEMSTYTNIELGSYDPTAPNSSFASVTGETFSIVEAAANPEKIDWIYFDGVTYGNTIMAPSNDIILQVFASVGSWTTRNATKFVRTSLNAATFDAIPDKNTLIAAISPFLSSLTLPYISELMPAPGEGFDVGEVFAFKTAGAELLGLIKITEVNPGATNGLSTIKYDVKIQQ
jgi:hypothetical protein